MRGHEAVLEMMLGGKGKYECNKFTFGLVGEEGEGDGISCNWLALEGKGVMVRCWG